MGEVIDPTLLAYQFDDPVGLRTADDRLARVATHYQRLAHEELERREWRGSRIGIAAFHDPVVPAIWPWWSEDPEAILANAYLPVGWNRIIAPEPPAAAALKLARVLAQNPERVALEMNAPIVLVVVERPASRVQLINDCLGAGRLYEMAFDGGRAWSNRVGALPIFAGRRPEADERGWALFAAGGWFMRDTTPVRGVAKVPPASVIALSDDEDPRRTQLDGVAQITSRQDPMDELVERVAADAQSSLRAASELFPERPMVDLSGGKDSRISAAAAISANIDVELRTSDVKPGEADIARELVALAPWQPDHKIAYSEGQVKQRDEPLRVRALSAFLLHDGMRYAGKVRGRLQLPPPPSERASVSGHGGEIAHGFYYTNAKKLRLAEADGFTGLVDRLMINSRRTHGAARDFVYEIAQSEYESALAEGQAAGISGPALLDWFYLMDRFAHRSGLASNTQRLTVFSSPSFIQAAFSLQPEERLNEKLHRAITGSLIPAWRDVRYYDGSGLRTSSVRRVRIWEDADGRSMRSILKTEEAWRELFDPGAIRKLWLRTKLPGARSEWEQVFERIVCRVAFEDWAEEIGRAARG